MSIVVPGVGMCSVVPKGWECVEWSLWYGNV